MRAVLATHKKIRPDRRDGFENLFDKDQTSTKAHLQGLKSAENTANRDKSDYLFENCLPMSARRLLSGQKSSVTGKA